MAPDKSSQKAIETPTKTGAGSLLKRAREKAGVSLQHISDQTLIPIARLTALEKEDFERVGGSAYVVGYARNAAQAIGVDPKPIVDAFSEILKKADASREKLAESNLEPIKGRLPQKKLKTLILVVGLALFVAILALILLLLRGESREDGDSGVSPASSEQILSVAVESNPKINKVEKAPLIERTLDEAESPIDSELDNSPELASDLVLDDSVDVELAEPESELTVGIDQADDRGSDILSSGEAQDENYVYSEPQVESKLDLFFTDECWVKVTDASGKRLTARVANGGDHISVTGLTPFEVMLGNARASTIELNSEVVSFTPKKGKRTLRLSVGN